MTYSQGEYTPQKGIFFKENGTIWLWKLQKKANLGHEWLSHKPRGELGSEVIELEVNELEVCAALETDLAYSWAGFIGYTGYQWKLTSGPSDPVSMRKEVDRSASILFCLVTALASAMNKITWRGWYSAHKASMIIKKVKWGCINKSATCLSWKHYLELELQNLTKRACLAWWHMLVTAHPRMEKGRSLGLTDKLASSTQPDPGQWKTLNQTQR